MELLKNNSGGSLVSVCIPSYNASKFIHKTIRSVLKSNYLNFEIIISDDASDDDSVKIIKTIKDSRIRLIENDNRVGVPLNWNRVLREANGEFIGLLNHDDMFGPFWLTFAVHVLDKYSHIGWVATAFYVINDKNEIMSVESRFPKTQEYNLAEAFLCVTKLDGLGPGFIARKEVIEEVGYYDKDTGPSADNDLFLQLSSRFPLYYSNYPHTFWRLHQDNLTHRWTPIAQAKDGFKMLKKIFQCDNLSKELQKFKQSCFTHYYQKIQAHAEELKRKGDCESYDNLRKFLKSYWLVLNKRNAG